MAGGAAVLSRIHWPACEPYLAEVLDTLWPAPTSVVRAGRGRPSGGKRDYLVIPSARRPKLVVPAAPSRLAAAAIRNYNTAATTRRQRIKITTLAAVVRLGLGLALPDRVRIDQGAHASVDLRTHLSELLGRRIDLCLYISPPRAVRKPVLQLLVDDGTTVAFAKLGINEFTDTLVRSETQAITRLSQVEWATLRVPMLLHAGLWHGHELLVQSALARGSDPADHTTLVARAMDELARSSTVTTQRLAESDYLVGLIGRLDRLPSDETAQLLRAALADISSLAGTKELEFGSWHGDWTPWNMTIAAGRALVWDWEKFDDGVPIGFDAVHYAVQQAIVLNQLSPAAAFERSTTLTTSLLAAQGRNREHVDVLSWLYVIEIAVRYLLDGESEAGTRAGQVTAWVRPVLQRMAERNRI